MRSKLPWETPAKSFVSAVRDRSIPNPAQRTFSEERWKQAFQDFAEPSLADTRLFYSGLFFSLRFGEVRTALAQAPKSRLAASERVKRFVGYGNYLLLAAEKKLEPNLHPVGSVDSEQRIEALHEFLRWGDHHVTSLVDGLRFAIAEQWRIEADMSAHADMLEEVAAVSRAAMLGRLYDALEDAWNHCVWRGWYFTSFDDHPMIVASDIGLEDRKAVGDFRHAQLSIESGLVSHEAWEKADGLLRETILSRLRVIDIKKIGKEKVIVVGTGHDKGAPTHADVAALCALDSYTQALADRPSPFLAGLTVGHLLAAWYVLAPLAELLFRNSNVPVEVANPSVLKHLSATISVAELQRVLTKTLGITERQSSLLLELLTFRDDHKIDLWSRPFVALDSGNVGVLRPVLSATNLNRLVTRWIRDVGFSLDERGPRWEDEVRKSVCVGNRLPNAEVHPRSFEFQASSGTEEIDFMARIGNTVLVGESKCSLIPTNAHDYARFVSLLANAAEQVGRKAAAIRGEAKLFLQQIGWKQLSESLIVIPFVITNQPVGVGHQFDGVPVVDRLILERYFNEGELLQGVLRAGTTILSTAQTLRFYSTPEEAERNVASYLNDPPQLRIARANVLTEPMPLPAFSQDELACHILVRRVSLPPAWFGGDKPDWLQPNAAPSA